MKIFLISDNTDTKTGLRLAGVSGAVAHTKKEFETELNGALGDRSVGILLITEKLAKRFPELIDEVRLGRNLPLVVEIPDRHGAGRGGDFITEYVRNAIGLRL